MSVYQWHTGGVRTAAQRDVGRGRGALVSDYRTPMADGVISAADADRVASLFRALSDPARVRLLSLIASHEGGEACVCELTDPVGLSQPTVSHHLKQLVSAGLVTRDQRGRWAYYSVNTSALNSFTGTLHSAAFSQAGREPRQ